RPPASPLLPYTTLFRSTAAEFATTAVSLRAAGFPAEATAVRFSGAIAATRRGDHSGIAPRLPPDAPTPLRLRAAEFRAHRAAAQDRKSTRLNSSHVKSS